MKFRREKRQKGLHWELALFAVLALISFFTLFASDRNLMPDVKSAGLNMFSGLRSAVHGGASFVSGTVLAIQELAALRQEYLELTQLLARYEQLERSAAEIQQENFRLREQLGFSQSLRFQHIPAQIIGRDPHSLFSAFVINKGRRAGVNVDMPVIAFHSGTQGLVGKVIHAGAFESFVMPLYDTACFVSSRLAESRFEGIVEGQGLPEVPLRKRFISRRARDEISIGDLVISSGMGGIFPPGISIGRVSRIHYQENALSMEVELESSIDFSRLEHVFVIKQIEDAPGDPDD